ncbi:hypothetical protein K491DRAFT_578340, partial [Lophiostoma macrostomum CBS 122681]
LFVIGGDIVRTALAQVINDESRDVVVGFGFGWAQYAMSSLIPVFSGQRNVAPPPEIRDMQVMNMTAGHVRTNHSFVLSRLLRDLEKHVDSGSGKVGGLSVTIVDTMDDPTKKMELMEKFKYRGWPIGHVTMAAQMLLSLKAGGMVPIIFILAQILASCTLELPVWKKEKFAARRGGDDVYALMRGNGNRHVFIVRTKAPNSWNLEDMAAASIHDYDWYNWEGVAAVGLAIGWFVLFALACSVKDQAGWLLAVMTIGHIGNLFSAFYPRSPAGHGFHLDMNKKQTIANAKVMETLKELEVEHEGYGEKLLGTFFPGGLWDDDKNWWADRKNKNGGDSNKTVAK